MYVLGLELLRDETAGSLPRTTNQVHCAARQRSSTEIVRRFACYNYDIISSSPLNTSSSFMIDSELFARMKLFLLDCRFRSNFLEYHYIRAVCGLQIGSGSREDPMKDGFGTVWSTLILKRTS